MNKDRVLSLLGLAKKAGCVKGGEFLTENAVRSGISSLVIIATDSSDNTKKKFRDMCTFHEVPYYEYSDKDSLGHAIGTEFRASITVNNEGFAAKLQGLLEAQEN